MQLSTQQAPASEHKTKSKASKLPRLASIRNSQTAGVNHRWLAPAMMWAELEHFRKTADLVEEPFSLLVLTSGSALSPRVLHPSPFAALQQFADVLGPIGMLDRKRVGLVIRSNCEDEIGKFAGAVQELMGGGRWGFAVLSYPFAVEREIYFPDQSGRMSRIAGDSLQPLFALPTPWGKRAIDVAVALLGLLILLPILTLVAVMIRCTSAGPIFFKQRRSGLGGIPFEIYKFRTMVANAEQQRAALKHLNEQDGPAFKMRSDPRVTGLGRWLRYTCIDELPQLWNVLKGEMSLVGPRPLPCEESNACRWWQRRRLDVLPGVTCTWQARGRSMVSFDEWMRMDLDYVRRRSLGLDFQILICTFAFLISRNAYEPSDGEIVKSADQCVTLSK